MPELKRKSPPPQSAVSPRVRRRVKVKFRSHYDDGTWGEEEEKEVFCWVLGDVLAVHESVNYVLDPENVARRYSVTVISVGLRCVEVPDEADALRIAECLIVKCPKEAFKPREAKKVEEALPPWVKGWLDKCKEAGKFLEPFKR